jgi:hypothetical protein
MTFNETALLSKSSVAISIEIHTVLWKIVQNVTSVHALFVPFVEEYRSTIKWPPMVSCSQIFYEDHKLIS